MKVVILAGGFGMRLSEETQNIPKPMVEIGDKPILWYIMKVYSHYGYNDFIICLGYKGYIIKEYFKNYFLHNSDVTIDLKKNKVKIHNTYSEPWNVTLVDTGLNALTGGRIKRIAKYINDETFMLTYGDSIGDINIKELVSFHNKNKKLATLTAVQPEGRFGALELKGNQVLNFAEKKDNKSWVNGGFFVLEPEVLKYIEGNNTKWEGEPLERLATEGQLIAYRHRGFWKAMDKLSDKMELEKIWKAENPPWRVWKD